jgi:hypothetical protein
MAMDTSYAWVAVRPLGAGFGWAFGVIDGGLLPVPPEVVTGADEPTEGKDGAPVPLAPALVPAPPLSVEAVVPAAVEAVLAADDVIDVVGLVVAELAGFPKGLCAAPLSREWGGVDWTFSAGSVVAGLGGGVAIGA